MKQSTSSLGGGGNLESTGRTADDIKRIVPSLNRSAVVRPHSGIGAFEETDWALKISPEKRAKFEKAIMREARRLSRLYLLESYRLRFLSLLFKARYLLLFLRRQMLSIGL